MFCNKCGTPLSEGSAFCNKCGASQKSPPATPAAPVPVSTGAEETLWKGHPSFKSTGHWWILWFAGLLGLIALHFSMGWKDQNWLVWVYAAALVIPALWIAGGYLVDWLTTRYRVTSHRLFEEKGLLSRTIHELELIRVDDVFVSQNLIQRIFNVGNVTVISTDATNPRMVLEGIDDPVTVKELIRTYMKRGRGGALHIERL